MFNAFSISRSMLANAVLGALTILALPVHADDFIGAATSEPYPSTAKVDAERNNSSAIFNSIRADYAYAHGISGKGVTIAILDTGVSTGHREFSATDKLMSGFNAVSGGADVADHAGHGTHVAGIIGADRDGRGIFGVAYDARLLPVKVLPDSGSGSIAALDRGVRYAIGKAAIANMSLGAPNAYDPQAMQEAVRAGMLIVAAAGNERSANPSWPARFAKEAWAKNQIIAVGAVDGANRIAPFSNRAGDTAAWFIVAPGVNVVSSYPNGQYAYMSGTSMAAPVVSGAAALLLQMWPSLRAEQVASILFLTATDLGAPGIDPVYGRGLLNIEKALQPVGPVTTTTFRGRTINVLAGTTLPSSATSKLWSLAASGQLHVSGMDNFQRDFGIDLGATVARPASMSLEQVFGRMDKRVDVVEKVLSDAEVTLALEQPHADVAAASQRAGNATQRLKAFALLARGSNGMETMAGVGGMAGNHFGASGLRVGQELSLVQVSALSNPYFNLVPVASHGGIAQQIGDIKLKVGLLTSGFNNALASQYSELPSHTPAPRANAGVFELSKAFDGAALSLSLSQTRESNAWLGSYSSGALSLGTHAATSAVQFGAALLLAPKLALAGQMAYGLTPGGSTLDSLITEVSAVRTNAFALALIGSDSLAAGDRLSFSVSQPMRAYSGRIVMDVLTHANDSGMPTREHVVFSMVPLGRELCAEINYQMPLRSLRSDESVGVSLLLRHEPNNMVAMAMEKLLAMRYIKRF